MAVTGLTTHDSRLLTCIVTHGYGAHYCLHAKTRLFVSPQQAGCGCGSAHVELGLRAYVPASLL